MELFLCPSCHLALWEPVTVSCGHSFCRRCLPGESPSQCCVCGDELVLLGSRTVQCNVLLGDLLEKCLDKGTRVARLKGALADLLRSGDCKGALQTLQKGVSLAPDDLELRMCRSEVHVSLEQYPEALKDLEMLCIQEPEECEDLKDRQEVWQDETVSGQNLASLSLPECLWKKSESGVSAKEEDTEKGATAGTPGAKSTQDIRSHLSTLDLECSLCIRMFFEPVTTPCGHTFCKECVERSLDHRPNCPLCKQSLREYLKARKYSTTVVLEELMSTIFPSQLADRKQIHQTEMAELSNLTKNIPIFVCTLAFPGIVCSLHVFEPRYRLMIRRCRETGTKMFGMCISENGKSFADYGCMLEIQKIDFLPDGRSFVNTTGKRRFRVLRRGHKDGYNTADIEYLEDEKVEGEELTELQNLHDCTYDLTQRFYENGYMTFRRSLMHYGPLPEKEEDIQASPDGPAWCWWLILTLPLDVTRKLAIFSDTSLKSRLTQLKNILNVILESSEFSS